MSTPLSWSEDYIVSRYYNVCSMNSVQCVIMHNVGIAVGIILAVFLLKVEKSGTHVCTMHGCAHFGIIFSYVLYKCS